MSDQKYSQAAELLKKLQSDFLPIPPETVKNDFEKEEEKSETLSLDDQRKKIDNDGEKDNQALKKAIFNWTQKVVNCYLWFVGCVVLFVSVKFIFLDNSVMIALLTTTAATIISLPALIIKSLFPKDKTDKNSKNSN